MVNDRSYFENRDRLEKRHCNCFDNPIEIFRMEYCLNWSPQANPV